MSKMNRLVGLFVMIVCFGVSSTAHAQTVSMQQALSRMDEIIAEMQKLRTEFSGLASSVGAGTPAVLGAQTASSIGFTQPLEYGATNDDIAYIQKLLATDPEIYPYGVSSGFFGPKTQEAIRNLQSRFGLDPVGVVGPATRTILEAFLAAYPTGNFPADVLTKIPTAPAPQVQGAATNVTPTPTPTPTASYTGKAVSAIAAEFDDGVAYLRIQFQNGTIERPKISVSNKTDLITELVKRLNLSAATIGGILDVDGDSSSSRSSSRVDDNDAEDAIDDADEAIDDAQDAIDEADDDGEDIDYADELLDDAKKMLRKAEDAFDDEEYEDAVDYANEAEDLAGDAEGAIGESRRDSGVGADDIDEIEIEVEDGMAYVTVYYEDGDEEEFEIEEDNPDDILDELSDELDVDVDDLEDLVTWDYGDVDYIVVTVEDGDANVRVEYESGVRVKFTIDEEDEDDMISEIADEIDEDEDDVEKWTDFDYVD